MTIHNIKNNGQILYSKDLDKFVLGEGDKTAALSKKKVTYDTVYSLNAAGYEREKTKLLKQSGLEKIFSFLGIFLKTFKDKQLKLKNIREQTYQKIENTSIAENELKRVYSSTKDHTLKTNEIVVAAYQRGQTSLDDIFGKKE